ncbi:MAG: alpha/beta fold hydrolase [Myxococcaceae bacterium]|nr:alpha/beta fold hydrolase [Myxococcaceae bacterium]
MDGRRLLWIGIALAVALLVGAAAYVAFRLRNRRLEKRVKKIPPRLRHPVVLAHGILGFDKVGVGGLAEAAYFRGVAPRLTKLGAKVYAFQVRPSASVAARAEDLRLAVQALGEERVNVIAHSMGGLDARYAVAKLGLADKVASITTIGTPHHGTPLADLGTNLWGLAPAARRLLEAMGVDVSGFFDLTTERMRQFNAEVPDVRGIFYGSYVARTSGGLATTHPLLVPTWKLIRERAGDNDGLVPVHSQQWGERLGEIEADHWAQIGWSRAFDAPAFYEALVRELMQRGL